MEGSDRFATYWHLGRGSEEGRRKKHTMGKIYYTVSEVQEMLGLRRQTVYMMLETGQIPALKLNKIWRVPIDKFNQWLENETCLQTKERSMNVK